MHGAPDDSPGKTAGLRYLDELDSDTDFQARGASSDGEESGDDIDEGIEEGTHEDLGDEVVITRPSQVLAPVSTPKPASANHKPQRSPVHDKSTWSVSTAQTFQRAKIPPPPPFNMLPTTNGAGVACQSGTGTLCLVCSTIHPVGYCPVKQAGVEHCGLCGIAHFGSGFIRNCPHLNSVTQCRVMLETLKSSTEPKADIELARKYIVGVIGNLRRKKKMKAQAQALQASEGASHGQNIAPYANNGDSARVPNANGVGAGKENHLVTTYNSSSKLKNT